MIIGAETLFFAPNLIQWVNCNMGKTWMGAQAVWWLSLRDAKSRSLWSPTKGKCSVNQHCYISKCAFLHNFVIECSLRGAGWKILIVRDERRHLVVFRRRFCLGSACGVTASIGHFSHPFNSLQLAWKTTCNADLTSLHRIVSLCSYEEREKKNNGQSRLKLNKECEKCLSDRISLNWTV